MSSLRLNASTFGQELTDGFARIRRELEIPEAFPSQVLAEADRVASRGPVAPPGARGTTNTFRDHRGLELVTIDPPGSTDLDQAFAAEVTASGYRVWYAIADTAAFIEPGGAIDLEARERGVTQYSPDLRTSLHPETLNEGAASLLPGKIRPAVVWTIDLDHDAALLSAYAERGIVQSRYQLTYRMVQDHIDRDTDHSTLQLLREIGELRIEQEAARGAISLQLPSQEIEQLANGDYELRYDTTLPVEHWNAQISLLTGMAAADIMKDAGQGLLRTLPPLDKQSMDQVRRMAKALGVDWPAEESYANRVRRLTPNVAAEAALLTRAARGFRGAGYAAFTNGELPTQQLHAAIASTYSHVTAPLRRVCDRYANEIVLAACADQPTPEWALEGLDELPGIMNSARQRERALERATADFVEALALRSRVGESFEGVVLSHRRKGSNILLREPAVLAGIDEEPEVGTRVNLRLADVNVEASRLDFELAPTQ